MRLAELPTLSEFDRLPENEQHDAIRQACAINGVFLFDSATDMIRALGWEDPDPAFTELYHAAHVENANRDASAAFERVSEHVKVMNARWRNR